MPDSHHMPAPGFFSRLFGRKKADAAPLQPCFVVAALQLIDRGIALDGLVVALGTEGLQFRPASSFIFDRRGAEVLVRFADVEVRGQIRATNAQGYRLAFETALPEETIAATIRNFGFGPGFALVDSADSPTAPEARPAEEPTEPARAA